MTTIRFMERPILFSGPMVRALHDDAQYRAMARAAIAAMVEL